MPEHKNTVIAEDDTLSSVVGDSMRLAIIFLLGHFASCMYVEKSELFGEDFVNSLLFYVVGTIIFYIFFAKKFTLSHDIVFPMRQVRAVR
jgi:hypothetical protein